MKKIGEKIKILREARSWNYKQLAEKAGVSDRMVSMIENGQNCSIETLIKIADALQTTPAYLLS